MEEEDKSCLKIHGYVSEDDSDFEQPNFELDDRYELFKPPAIQINPIDHRIIEVADPIPPNKQQKQKKHVSFAEILKQSKAQNNGQHLPQSASPADGKTLSKSQKKKLKRKFRKKNSDSGSGAKIIEDLPNDSLGQVDNNDSYIWCDEIDYDNKFPLLGHNAAKKGTAQENKPAREPCNYLNYPNDSTDFKGLMSLKDIHLNGESKDYKDTEIKTNIKIAKEIELISEIHMTSASLENSTQSENAVVNKLAKKRRRNKAKKGVSKDALRSKGDNNHLYYPYENPKFVDFMTFKVVGEYHREFYKNPEFKTNVKTPNESELTSSLDSEIQTPNKLQCSLENSTQMVNAEEEKKRTLRVKREGSKKLALKNALISECDTNYLYYPYDSPDFDRFMSFKEIYLNGELKDYHRTEETTNVETEKKSELTSNLYSEIHISSILQCYLNNSTQFENVELSIEFLCHQGTDFYEVFISTQRFLTNLVKLALQQIHTFTKEQLTHLTLFTLTLSFLTNLLKNHTFTKEQLSHLNYVYRGLMRVHALFEDFSRTSTFLQFSKDSVKESTTRKKQNDLVHLGQTICRNMGVTFSVEEAYMIVGKFYCSLNLKTEDLPNSEAKENKESEHFLLLCKHLNFMFNCFIGTVLLNVVWIVKQKLHELQIRQRPLVSVSDKRLINHFLKPEDFDMHLRAYSHLCIKNPALDKFIMNCLYLNQDKPSLMRTYQSLKQKRLMYDCTKVNETNLSQLRLEDLTENRRYHYTTYNKRDLEYWQNFQECYQNKNENLTPVVEESDIGTISRENICTNLFTKIWDEYFYKPESALKTLFFYVCLKYFLLPLLVKMTEIIFVYGIDITILIVLLIFFCIQFIL